MFSAFSELFHVVCSHPCKMLQVNYIHQIELIFHFLSIDTDIMIRDAIYKHSLTDTSKSGQPDFDIQVCSGQTNIINLFSSPPYNRYD